MTIVRATYRYKRPPRKRKPNPAALTMPRIVHAKTPKPGSVPRIKRPETATPANDDRRLVAQADEGNDAVQPTQQRKSALVTIRRRKHATLAHLLDDMTPEEHKRRGDAADALWREMVRRVREG